MRYFYCFFLWVTFSCSKTSVDADSLFVKGSILIVNGGENSISVFDAKSLTEKGKYYINTVGNTYAHHIYFSKDFSKISIALPEFDFSNGHDALHNNLAKGNVFVLNIASQSSRSFPVAVANHNAIYSNDNKEIWTSLVSHSGKIQVFDAEKFEMIKEIPVGSDPSEIIFAKNGELAVVACGESSFLTVIDVQKKIITKEIKIDPFPTGVWPGWSTDIVFVENANKKSMNIVDLSQLKVIGFIDFDFVPGFSIYNKKTQEIWVCSKKDSSVYVFEQKAAVWTKKAKINTENDPHQIAFFDNSSKAIVINQMSSTAQIFDVATKTETKKLNTGLKPNGIAVWE